jgi:23S rRNA (uracil1939-C5)-methyltransferase
MLGLKVHSSVQQTVRIEKLVHGGDGLARVDGQVVLIPFTLPAELVSVDIQPVKKGVARGRLLEVIEPSPNRRASDCAVFGKCGGCQLRHTDNDAQVRAKVDILRETLARIGKVEFPGEIQTHTASSTGYRNRIQLHFREGRVGFVQEGSHQLVATNSCPNASPKLNEVMATMAKIGKQQRFPRFLKSVEFFSDERQVQVNVLDSTKPLAKWFFDWLSEEISGFVGGPLTYRVGNHDLRVSGKSFFQINRHLLSTLVEVVVGHQQGERALDLYGGVGLFGLNLATKFGETISVESSRSASEDGVFNGRRAKLPISFVHSSVEPFLVGYDSAVDLVVADPPRSGLGAGAASELVRILPKKLVLVSCDPATLARDLQVLTGKFQLTALHLLDLFPGTAHLETIAILEQ